MSRKIAIRTAYSVQRIAYSFVLLTFLFTVNCYAVTWSSNELIEKAKELNGRNLNYKGELITAVLNRGEHSWINVNDGFNAIGVWCKSSMLSEVKFVGDYKNRGDIIEVNGTLNRACSLHNGELDIHADTIKILKQGYPMSRAINIKRVESAAALFVIVLLAVIVFRKKL